MANTWVFPKCFRVSYIGFYWSLQVTVYGCSGCTLNNSGGIIHIDCSANSIIMQGISCTEAYSSPGPLRAILGYSTAQYHNFLSPKIPFNHIILVSETGNQVRMNIEKVCFCFQSQVSPQASCFAGIMDTETLTTLERTSMCELLFRHTCSGGRKAFSINIFPRFEC